MDSTLLDLFRKAFSASLFGQETKQDNKKEITSAWLIVHIFHDHVLLRLFINLFKLVLR